MGNTAGRFLPLSLARRMICEFQRVSQSIPLAHGEGRLDIRPLREAVANARPRPSWVSIFFKAYSIVAAKRPALRRHYVSRPRPRLYEHDKNIGSIVIARTLLGEDALFFLPIATPEQLSLGEIDKRMREARRRPLEEIPAFRRQLRLGRWPWLLRQLAYRLGMNWMGRRRARYLGTFGMSVLASRGAATLAALAPWPTMIHFTPFDDAGSIFFRMAFDHRVVDGIELANAVAEMERVLNSAILHEVQALARPPRGPVSPPTIQETSDSAP